MRYVRQTVDSTEDTTFLTFKGVYVYKQAHYIRIYIVYHACSRSYVRLLGFTDFIEEKNEIE